MHEPTSYTTIHGRSDLSQQSAPALSRESGCLHDAGCLTAPRSSCASVTLRQSCPLDSLVDSALSSFRGGCPGPIVGCVHFLGPTRADVRRNVRRRILVGARAPLAQDRPERGKPFHTGADVGMRPAQLLERFCRLSQNSAMVPNQWPSRIAVSAVIARVPLRMPVIVGGSTLTARSRPWATRSSSAIGRSDDADANSSGLYWLERFPSLLTTVG